MNRKRRRSALPEEGKSSDYGQNHSSNNNLENKLREPNGESEEGVSIVLGCVRRLSGGIFLIGREKRKLRGSELDSTG